MSFLPKNISLKSKYYLFSLAFLIFATSCGSVPEYSKHIPEQTSVVVSVNLSNITSKASNWQDLIGEEFLKRLTTIGEKNAKTWADNLLNSSIDISETVHIFSYNPTDKSPAILAMILPIGSDDSFKKFIENTPDRNWKVQTDEATKINFSTLDKKSIVAWKDELVIYLQSPVNVEASSLKKNVFALLELPEENSLIKKNESFASMQEEQSNHEISIWVDASKFEKIANKQKLSFSASKLNLSNNFLTTFIDFEKGKVNITGDFTINGSQKQFENFLAQGISNNLLDRSPIENPMALLSFHLNFKEIQSTLQALGFSQDLMRKIVLNTLEDLAGKQFATIEPFFREMPVDDIFRLLEGDIFVALKGIQEVNYTIETVDEEGEADVQTNFRLDFITVIAFTVSDKEELQEWLNTMRQSTSRLRDRGMYYQLRGQQKVNYFLILQGNYFFITADTKLRNAILEKKYYKLSEKFKPKPESWFLSFVNVDEKTRKRLPPSIFDNDKRKEKEFKEAIIPILDIQTTMSTPKQDKLGFAITLNLDDKEKNALSRLIEWIQNTEKLSL